MIAYSMKRHIPNFITSLNLVSGFAAIIYTANNDLITASWLILAAMIFDFLDGFAARLLKAYSAIGKELDSLADIVSFGVAPGFIIYQWLDNSISAGAPFIVNNDGVKATLILLLPAVMPVCAALRLAIFNIDDTQSTTFRGMPTPANALAVISIVLAGHYSETPLLGSLAGSPLSIILFMLCLSLLMVSRIPLLSLKVKNLKIKGNEGRYILIGLIILAFIFFGFGAAPVIIPLYIISSLIALLF
jgi:CDP-diacylglycerol--serine O-phosphatidyltransferase